MSVKSCRPEDEIFRTMFFWLFEAIVELINENELRESSHIKFFRRVLCSRGISEALKIVYIRDVF